MKKLLLFITVLFFGISTINAQDASYGYEAGDWLLGGGVTFGDFTVRFIVDEDLKNYYSIHSWMRDNGNADQMARQTPEKDIYTDGQLHIVTSQYNPAFVVEFRDLFPVSLTNLQFDATISDVEYITAEVTFKHQQFFIRDKDMQPL